MKLINIKSTFKILAFLFLLILAACRAEGVCNECYLQPDPGTCKAYELRYYWDKKDSMCKEFIWGGCEGVVPFDTLDECLACDCD